MNEDRQPSRPSDLVRDVEATLRKADLSVRDRTVVVGVSGGVDSMVLASVLRELRARVQVVHVNYGLRAEESDADELLVRSFCSTHDFPLAVFCAAPKDDARKWKTSIQDAARRERYQFFRAHAENVDSDLVAVAHNRDDSAETMLLQLARGTGLRGAAGMRVNRSLSRGSGIRLIRPLLEVSRETIVSFANEQAIQWREDLSNANPSYARARIRSIVRPAFENAMGVQGWSGLARSARLLSELIGDDASDIARLALGQVARPRRLDVVLLRQLSVAECTNVLLDCLSAWLPAVPRSEVVANELRQLLFSPPGSMKAFEGGTIINCRDCLEFRDAVTISIVEHPLDLGHSYTSAAGVLRVDELVHAPVALNPNTPNATFVDLDKCGKMRIRAWRFGEEVTALGLAGSKKVARLMTDAKVSPSLRQSWPVVASEADHIVWIPGVRAVDGYHVSDTTARVGMMTWYPHES
ncbi:MAG: tRNA lysidine(34) synthetase TilS [Rhodothermales bacterium]